MCSEQNPLSHLQMFQMGIFGFSQMGIFGFSQIHIFETFTERDWSQEYCHGNNIVGVALFLLRCSFLVPKKKV